MKKCEITDYQTIINTINNGEIIAIPTDTIYGLATSVKSYQKILKLKKREQKPLAILCSSFEEMQNIIEVKNEYIDILKNYMPGALTIVGKNINDKYDINEGYTTTGVRIPNHKSLLNILKQTGPLVVSSANISGETETFTINEVYKVFKDDIDLYVENDQQLSKEASVVIDINTLTVYRSGANSEKIIQALKNVAK